VRRSNRSIFLRSTAHAAQPINGATLAAHGDRVLTPAYDRDALRSSVVHIGVGGFHRAHQAVYLDDLANRGASLDWGVTGVCVRRPTARDVLAGQDFLYTVLERSGTSDRARIVGALQDCLFAPESREAVLALLADPAIRLVTLTVTGNAYTEKRDDPADLGTFALIAEGLERRRAAGIAPFTVLSCDNIPDNGEAAMRSTLAAADERGRGLSGWVAANGAFPNSVVDRITPEASEEVRETLASRFGIIDSCPVVTEEFSQWVIEDRFCAERPPLGAVGARFVDDVAAYALTKKRMLNGGHCALGYVGTLLGHRTTASAMADPLIEAFIDRLLADEVAPLLPTAAGLDLDLYREKLLERFANPRLEDELARLCGRGSTKMPAYLLPSLDDAVSEGRPIELLALVVAAWMRYLRGVDLQGRRIRIHDAHRTRLQSLACAGGADPSPLLACDVFDGLGENPVAHSAVSQALNTIDKAGLRSAIRSRLVGEVAAVPA